MNLIPAKYTEVLGNIAEYGYNLFDFEYDSFIDKDVLQNGFLDYYYFREIAFETIEMFMQRLRVRWLSRIDRYNKIFEADAEVSVADAFKDRSDTGTDTTESARDITTDGQSVFNDAPLGEVAFDNSHASAITNTEGTNKDTFKETRTHTASGLSKSKAEAALAFDRALRDHVEDFYREFRDLFFGLF